MHANDHYRMKGRLRRRHCPGGHRYDEVVCNLRVSVPALVYYVSFANFFFRYLCHRTSNLEAPGSIGRPQYHWPRVIMASRCLILSLDRISFLTPLLLSGSLIYLQAIMAMYHTFSNHTTAWESADLQCFKFPLTVCVFIYRSLETVYTIYAVWTRTP